MCGIVGYVSRKEIPVVSIYQGLKRLEYRGYDGWGLVYQKDKVLVLKKGSGKLGHKTVILPLSKLALGHTRWATHGGNSLVNNHPHIDCSKSIALVHNGVIENYYQLKKEVINKKHHLTSETDTELIAHLIEDQMLAGICFEDSVNNVFKRLEGFNALVVIEKSQEKIVAVKTGSPLIIGVTQDAFWVTSDINALSETKKIIALDDGELAIIEKNGLEVRRVTDGKVVQKKPIKIVGIKRDSQKGEFGSFLDKEINEQPEVLERIVKDDGKEIQKIISLAKRMQKVIVVGCGTSYHAGLIVSEKIISILGKWSIAVLASEFLSWLELIDKNTLVIAISQSGETIDVIDSLIKAKQKGATIVSIVNTRNSSIQRLSSICQQLDCGSEISVASTKSFIAQMAIFDKALGINISQRSNTVTDILKIRNRVDTLAKLTAHEKHLFILGRGKMLPLAMEGALKLKEICYIHAEGMAGGELKHGTLALIEKGSICIVLVSDERKKEIITSALEVKSRGARVIGIAKSSEEVFDIHLPLFGNRDDEQTEAVIWLQLLASKIGRLKHLDVDMPRNLAKSVTVK